MSLLMMKLKNPKSDLKQAKKKKKVIYCKQYSSQWSFLYKKAIYFFLIFNDAQH
jgi:hypothetical protein